MNKQGENGIEWTEYTWNPVGGCKHGCEWIMPDGSRSQCYAKTVADRMKSPTFYQDGFEAHYYHSSRLSEPYRQERPSRIFLDSMSDLMGHWVPKAQIEAVLKVCRDNPRHNFQLLTKNAPRLLEFGDSFPDNLWVGVSLPPSRMMGNALIRDQQLRIVRRQLDVLSQLNVPVRWMIFEPLSFDVAAMLEAYQGLAIEWAVIGTASNGKKLYQPDPDHVQRLLAVLDNHNVPVFFKGNLRGNEGYTVWRQEYPKK